MNRYDDFEKTKAVYNDLIEFGILGSDENYSITANLIEKFNRPRKIKMEEYLKAWDLFLKENNSKKVDLYIHIPYCVEKCFYCYALSYRLETKEEVEEYVERLIKYLDFFADIFKGVEFNNFYMGGGDPGIVPEKLLDQLFNKIFSNFSFKSGSEKTVENDPRTTNKEKLEIIRSYGINRLSMGVQSLNPEALKASNRLNQTEEDVQKAVEAAKSVGFPVFNIDLIVGLHKDDKNSLIRNFKKIAEMGPDQISLYQLQPMRGYLDNVLKMKRSDFFKKRKQIYKESFPEIEKIANNNKYTFTDLHKSDDFNDADSISFKKEGLKSFSGGGYVAVPVNETHSILGIGQGAGSVIYNRMKCQGDIELTEDPMDYSFRGYKTNPKKESMYFLLSNISNKRALTISTLKEEMDEGSFNNAMNTFSLLEERGVVEISDELIEFKFDDAREKLLYSLFLFPREEIMRLVERSLSNFVEDEDDNVEEILERHDLSDKKPLSKDLLEKRNQASARGERIEGVILEVKESQVVIRDRTSGKKRKIEYEEDLFLAEKFLDYNDNFNLIMESDLSIDKLKKRDQVNLFINEDSGKVVLIERLTVIS